ncbi:MAG: hypothetical protein FWG79_04890 [Bacteroidales bacterium]|nr:hypothetical protein [Bacteroidales bacterium]
MMYLVLTAMLALNVSTAVLMSFLTVNDSIVATNKNFETKVESVYVMFEKALAENKEKVQESFDLAQEAKKLTAEFREHVQLLRTELISMSGKMSMEEAMDFNPRDLGRQDDYDTPSHLFLNMGKGAELRERIATHVKAMLELLPEEYRGNIVVPFDITGPFYDNSGKEIPWEVANFYKSIIVASITILNKLENDAMNLEIDVTNELFRLITSGDMTFDNVVARIIPKSTFVALGEVFEAEIFLVAFDSRTRVMANVNGQNIQSRDGVVEFKSQTSREGVFTVSGYLDVPGGERYPFKTEYVVAAPSASVSADKMNVFYVGVDNPVSLAVSGFDPSGISASISGSGNSITRSGSGYVVRVAAPSNDVTVSLTVRSGTSSKTAGNFRFRAKNIPDPIVLANGIGEQESVVDKGTLASGGGLRAMMKDFDFDLQVPVVSFTLVTTVGGDFQEQKSTSNRFTPQMITMINNARRGQRFSFEDIVVRMPTGNRTVRSFVLTIR